MHFGKNAEINIPAQIFFLYIIIIYECVHCDKYEYYREDNIMKKLTRIKKLLILSVFVILFVNEIKATGILYVRPRFSSNEYQKVWIKSIDVNVSMQDQVAVTHVDQVFFNELSSTTSVAFSFRSGRPTTGCQQRCEGRTCDACGR